MSLFWLQKGVHEHYFRTEHQMLACWFTQLNCWTIHQSKTSTDYYLNILTNFNNKGPNKKEHVKNTIKIVVGCFSSFLSSISLEILPSLKKKNVCPKTKSVPRNPRFSKPVSSWKKRHQSRCTSHFLLVEFPNSLDRSFLPAESIRFWIKARYPTSYHIPWNVVSEKWLYHIVSLSSDINH